jgi:hypothetical protein
MALRFLIPRCVAPVVDFSDVEQRAGKLPYRIDTEA